MSLITRLSLRCCLGVFMLSFVAGCTSIPDGIAPVTNFNSERYLGTWYEIARFDHSFERGLDNVTATYMRKDDGGIDVLNRGYSQADAKWEEATGKAYFVDKQDVGHLKVSFFGPFYASYVIMELDQVDYQYSVVTGPSRDFLWILARRPNIDKATLEQLLANAEQRGFDTSQLIWVAHDRQTER